MFSFNLVSTYRLCDKMIIILIGYLCNYMRKLLILRDESVSKFNYENQNISAASQLTVNN